MSYDFKLSGTSVKTYASVVSWDGIFSGGAYRGSHLVVPARPGQTHTVRPLDAYTFSVPLLVLGTSLGQFQDNVDTLRALANTSAAAITATRIKPSGAGDVTTTCTVACLLSEVAMVPGLLNGKLVLEVTNLDGCWYGAAVSPTIPAAITVAGTTRTQKATIVLPGAGTLTNTTTGTAITVTAGATLTTLTQTTTGNQSDVVTSGDPLGAWFTLAPGSNTITWSGAGTPTLTYYPAYL